MHNFMRRTGLIIIAGLLAGCGSTTHTMPEAIGNKTAAEANTKLAVMQSAGVDVLKLASPPDAKYTAADGMLHFKGPVVFDDVEVWLVPGASSVDDAIAKVPTQIISEFKDFKPDHTTDLTIAGSPAKRLVGKGHEADDGDDGAADVIVFKVGDHIFAACTHGETLEPLGEQWELAIVQTAEKP